MFIVLELNLEAGKCIILLKNIDLPQLKTKGKDCIMNY
jgi:hypothetical protein